MKYVAFDLAHDVTEEMCRCAVADAVLELPGFPPERRADMEREVHASVRDGLRRICILEDGTLEASKAP